MKRFITYAAAVLIGLVSAQAPPAEPAADNNSPSLQSDFNYKSSLQIMPWDAVSLAANAMSCKIYDSLTLFDLQPIRGPYFIEVDIDGDENATKEELEVHFCNPVY